MSIPLSQFFSLPARHKLLLLKAWFLLGFFRAAVLCFPLKRLTLPLQHHAQAQPSAPLRENQQREAVAIGRLVAGAARVTPWQSLCLTQVLVVQRLLLKKNIPGQIYLGVRKGDQQVACPGTAATGLYAHAWLQSGDQIVNGGGGVEQFAVVSVYSWEAL
ncbi:lasso peptide biosynthesis B2 protein [Candidatus Seongchinamella marina]|uniref:lasso peptide biosynthesis B2 protein n=1 Tax=Candidatus Seongchinamella marina TaxID=2518990 RepID=UPI00242FCDB7|nr:lasso peptide biosynthesis B2 protein [Candidatus Seongchinamella marina]